MKILVTGANGYLGQGVVKSILDLGHDVIATDFSTDNVDIKARRIPCNLFEVKNPYNFFEQPDVLLHLAWRDGFVHYSDAHIEDLPLHYSFIKSMADANIRKIAVMGSMHEIGFYEGCINETTPCSPTTPYGIAKNALRDLTQMLTKKENIKFQWLRGYYIVGNTKYGSSIFSKLTQAEIEGKAEFPFTLGQNLYDFIDYEQFCEQVSKTVVQDQVEGVIEICSGKPERLSERVERFIKENKFDIKLKYGAFPDRPYDSKAIWGDDKKIQQVLKEFREQR